MIYGTRQIILKDGRTAILRSPDELDAADLLPCMKKWAIMLPLGIPGHTSAGTAPMFKPAL